MSWNSTSTDLPLIYTNAESEGNVERFGAFKNIQNIIRAESLDQVGLQGTNLDSDYTTLALSFKECEPDSDIACASDEEIKKWSTETYFTISSMKSFFDLD